MNFQLKKRAFLLFFVIKKIFPNNELNKKSNSYCCYRFGHILTTGVDRYVLVRVEIDAGRWRFEELPKF